MNAGGGGVWRAIFVGVVVALLSAGAIGVMSKIRPEWLFNALGVSTKEELETAKKEFDDRLSEVEKSLKAELSSSEGEREPPGYIDDAMFEIIVERVMKRVENEREGTPPPPNWPQECPPPPEGSNTSFYLEEGITKRIPDRKDNMILRVVNKEHNFAKTLLNGRGANFARGRPASLKMLNGQCDLTLFAFCESDSIVVFTASCS
jgi:hypothetical protein